MEKEQTLAEYYFQKKGSLNESEFLDLAKEHMFLAYLSKTLKETRKKYIIHFAKQTQSEIITDFQEGIQECGQEDIYEYHFDDIISHLTERQKQYLKLSFQKGYSDRQIALCMGICPQSVYDIKIAALKALRKEISSYVRK